MKLNMEKYSSHMSIAHEYRYAAKAALRQFMDGDHDSWSAYKENSKLANKHYGIAQAMLTRAYGRA